MAEGYVVVKTGNDAEIETEACLFDDRDGAYAYMSKYWKDYYDTEVENGSELDKEACFLDEESAAVTWADGIRMRLSLIRISPPDPDYTS